MRLSFLINSRHWFITKYLAMKDNKLSVDQYLIAHSTQESKILAELNRETNLKAIYPRMLSGQLLGKLLEFLSCMIKPKYILEIGTFTGYSAICLAKGLPENGKLITIDKNDELSKFPEKYFKKSGLSDKIQLLSGDALEIIPKLEMKFDLVFIDADKNEYLDYYKLCFDKINSGGFIIADNVLWDGKVLNKAKYQDKETQGIIAFNEFISKDPRIENIIIPLRDGISVIRKI